MRDHIKNICQTEILEIRDKFTILHFAFKLKKIWNIDHLLHKWSGLRFIHWSTCLDDEYQILKAHPKHLTLFPFLRSGLHLALLWGQCFTAEWSLCFFIKFSICDEAAVLSLNRNVSVDLLMTWLSDPWIKLYKAAAYLSKIISLRCRRFGVQTLSHTPGVSLSKTLHASFPGAVCCCPLLTPEGMG